MTINTALWPAVLDVEWLDDVEHSQHNMDLDGQLGQQVAKGERAPCIRIWRSGARAGIGVSRKDVASPLGQAAMAVLQAEGCDVVVRQTGGTAVPQGDGVLHVSYIFPRPAVLVKTDDYYRLLCNPLLDWLSSYNLTATTGALPGSYCDGTYNILVGGRKLVGTAQAWKGSLAGMQSLRPGYVIAHACIVADVNMAVVTDQINRFYELAGDDYRVSEDTSTTLRSLLPDHFSGMSSSAVTEHVAADLIAYYRQFATDSM